MTLSEPQVNLDIAKIMEIIPHRYPFLLVDKVIDIKGDHIIGVKNVTINEPYFVGHFPKDPVMPGVLIIEALAQVSAVLVAHQTKAKKDEKLVYFMSIDQAKFRKIVRPGDSLILKSNIVQHRSHVWKFRAIAEVDGVMVAESNFKAMIKNKE